MRIAVIGIGAMGSVYAGLLAAAGLDVWGVDSWTDHVETIRRDGLHVSGASGERLVRLSATSDIQDVGTADLVIIATKANGAVAAAHAARTILAQDGVVLTIQNGLGSADRVAEVIGPERVMVGVVGGFGASNPAPGRVHHNGWEFVRLGEYVGGRGSERLDRIGAVWEKGGFKVLRFPDIHKMVWEKFICNVAFSAPCAVTGMTIGEVLSDRHASAVSFACAREAYDVAMARGITLDFDDPQKYVREFGQKIPHARPSLLLDHMARRRSEIDVINGAVPSEAAKVGLQAPANATVSSIVRAMESRFPIER